jgi:rhodanese-related sulfurtransferase
VLNWLHGRAAEAADIAPDALAQALSGPNPPLLIDVRTSAEFAAGHIQGARLMPLSELGRRLGDLPKERPVVCVCRSGHRSGVAASQLRALGYPARNMAGGMLRWRGPVAAGTEGVRR